MSIANLICKSTMGMYKWAQKSKKIKEFLGGVMNQYLFRFARGIELRNVLALMSASIFTVSLQAAQLEEVVVTAQKRAQSENDIGISMTTWTGDEIRDMGVVSAEDMGLNTPGLTVNEAASTGIPVYTIRGVGFQDYSAGASSTCLLYTSPSPRDS